MRVFINTVLKQSNIGGKYISSSLHANHQIIGNIPNKQEKAAA